MPSENWMFLDESGSFEGQRNPEVVGGFWFSSKVSQSQARAFFEECSAPNPFHGCEITDNARFENILLAGIQAADRRGWRPIIFQSEQYLQIVNNPSTYLNLLVEGVIKWLRVHASLLQHRPLRIVVARRSLPVDETCQTYQSIPLSEYETRLTERLEIEWIRFYGRKYNPGVSIQITPAHEDLRLQLCDLFVHAWRREGLSQEIRAKYVHWIGSGWIRVFEGDLASWIRDKTADGHWAGALDSLTEALYRGDLLLDNPLVKSMLDSMSCMDSHALLAVLEQVVTLVRDRVVGKRELKRTQAATYWTSKLLPILSKEEKQDLFNWIAFRFHLIRLTDANHRGDLLNAEAIIREMEGVLKRSPLELDSLRDIIEYKILRGVHLTNCFDFESVETGLGQLCERMQALFEITVEEFGDFNWRSSLIGRIWGTLLQARMYRQLSSSIPDWESVRDLSERAIKLFTLPEDLSRQYQYRAQIETYAGEFISANAYLDRVLCPIEADDRSRIDACLLQASPFPLQHLLRLWVSECQSGNLSSNERSQMVEQYLPWAEKRWPCLDQYPWPSLYSLAHDLALLAGRDSVAAEFLQSAINSAQTNPDHLAIHTIALGVLLDASALCVRRAVCAANSAQRAKFESRSSAQAKRFEALLEEQIQRSAGTGLSNYLVELGTQVKKTPVESWLLLRQCWLPF